MGEGTGPIPSGRGPAPTPLRLPTHSSLNLCPSKILDTPLQSMHDKFGRNGLVFSYDQQILYTHRIEVNWPVIPKQVQTASATLNPQPSWTARNVLRRGVRTYMAFAPRPIPCVHAFTPLHLMYLKETCPFYASDHKKLRCWKYTVYGFVRP